MTRFIEQAALVALLAAGSLFVTLSIGIHYALLGIGGLLFILLCLSKPLIAAMSVLAFGFVNPSLIPPVVELGEFTFGYVDVAFIILAFTIGIKTLLTGQYLCPGKRRKCFHHYSHSSCG